MDGQNASTFSRLYRDWVQDSTRFAEMVYRKKLLIMQVSLSSELHMLTRPARPAGPEVAAIAGLHVQHAAASAGAGDRLLSRLPHYIDDDGPPRRRPSHILEWPSDGPRPATR